MAQEKDHKQLRWFPARLFSKMIVPPDIVLVSKEMAGTLFSTSQKFRSTG